MEKTTKVKTGKVRLSYANIWEPKTAPGATKAKYSVSIIIPKTDASTVKELNDAIAVAKEMGRTAKWGGKLPPNLKAGLRDGDVERPDDPVYKNSWFLNCTSDQQPGILKKENGKVQDVDAKTDVYSGCYAKVTLNMYPFDVNGSKGVAAGLNNILKIADGEPLSGRAAAEDDFADENDNDEI